MTLSEVHVGENWKRAACTKPSLVANGVVAKSKTSWNYSEKEDREGVTPNVDIIHKHGKMIYLRREFNSACGRCYPGGPWKLCELSVWSQGELSVRLPPGWGKRGRERGRGWVKKKGYFKMWTRMLQGGPVDNKLSPWLRGQMPLKKPLNQTLK